MSVARPDLLTPLHAVLKGHGAQFSQSAGGWLVASVYTDQQSEVSAARHAGLGRHIGEGAIPIVAVEGVGRWWR